MNPLNFVHLFRASLSLCRMCLLPTFFLNSELTFYLFRADSNFADMFPVSYVARSYLSYFSGPVSSVRFKSPTEVSASRCLTESTKCVPYDTVLIRYIVFCKTMTNMGFSKVYWLTSRP